MMRRVDFFVVGAPKTGTSWLAAMLQQHSALFIPEQKEIHYFNIEALGKSWNKNPNFFMGLDWYHAHFALSKENQLLGDMSPSYLSSETAPTQIKEYNPNAKIIVLMRNPTDRAYSDYLYRKQKGWLPLDCTFDKACKIFPDILRHSEYGRDIVRYMELFPEGNILMLFDDDIAASPASVVARVHAFLNVENIQPMNLFQRMNVTRMPAYPRLIRLITECKSMLFKIGMKPILDQLKNTPLVRKLRNKIENTEDKEQKEKPKLMPSERQEILRNFSCDIDLVQRLSGRSLDAWKV